MTVLNLGNYLVTILWKMYFHQFEPEIVQMHFSNIASPSWQCAFSLKIFFNWSLLCWQGFMRVCILLKGFKGNTARVIIQTSKLGSLFFCDGSEIFTTNATLCRNFSLFPIIRLTTNTAHGIAVSLRGALSGTLISYHANSFHVRACYCCWFTAFSLFVTDKTARWTNMTTNSWTGQDLHILKDSATFVRHYFTTFDKIP